MSISRVLGLNFGAFLFLPALSSINFNFLLRSLKSSSEFPQTTEFRKSSPSKPSAFV